MLWPMYFDLSSLGEFYQLRVFFNTAKLKEELPKVAESWRPYNAAKPHMKREGLSLFSLDGGDDGEIDLNSVLAYNKAHGTSLNEMSFRTPTKHWETLSSISEPLKDFAPMMGRTHLIRFEEGGYFPAHRDLGNSFRLVSFLSSPSEGLYVILNNKRIQYQMNYLYFMDTRLSHCIFNMMSTAMVLVINLEVSEQSVRTVIRHLAEI